jgi:AcrR family transcriptional regulator
MAASTTPTGRRRRDGAVLEEAIRAAVVELVIEQGVDGVTMESVAARARTSKPVLYRRWASRSELLRDSLLPLAMAVIPHVDTGSYRTDMLAILRGWAKFFRSPIGVVGPVIVGAMPHDDDLALAFRDGVIGWRKKAMREVIDRGIARGEVRRDVPFEIVRELGQAMLWHRFLVTGDRITDRLIVQIVDDILVPFVTPRG